MKKNINLLRWVLIGLALLGLLACGSGSEKHLTRTSPISSDNLVDATGHDRESRQYEGYIVNTTLEQEDFEQKIYEMVNYAPFEYDLEGNIINDISVGSVSSDPSNAEDSTGFYVQIRSDIDLTALTETTDILQNVQLRVEIIDSLVQEEELDPIFIQMGKSNTYTELAYFSVEEEEIRLEFTDTFGSLYLIGKIELLNAKEYFVGRVEFSNLFSFQGTIEGLRIPICQLKNQC